MIHEEIENLNQIQIDVISVLTQNGEKVTDSLEVEIPVKMGEKLSLVIDWALRPTTAIKTGNFQPRHATPTSLYGPPQQA